MDCLEVLMEILLCLYIKLLSLSQGFCTPWMWDAPPFVQSVFDLFSQLSVTTAISKSQPILLHWDPRVPASFSLGVNRAVGSLSITKRSSTFLCWFFLVSKFALRFVFICFLRFSRHPLYSSVNKDSFYFFLCNLCVCKSLVFYHQARH